MVTKLKGGILIICDVGRQSPGQVIKVERGPFEQFVWALYNIIKRIRNQYIFFNSDLSDFEDMYLEVGSDVTKYLANPINAYLLIKRLTTDWNEIEDVMKQNSYPGNLSAIFLICDSLNVIYPALKS